MTETILKHVADFCKEKAINPILIVEGGSRAWGFDTSESDYDVKVVFVHHPSAYQTLFEPQDQFTLQVDEMHSYSFWDLRKFLKLADKGNAAPQEMVRSSKIYSDMKIPELKEIVEEITHDNRLKVAWHYYGLAQKTYKQHIAGTGEQVPVKKYLYVTRALLMVEHMAGRSSSSLTGGFPPLEYDKCVNEVERDTFSSVDMALGHALRHLALDRIYGNANIDDLEDLRLIDEWCKERLEFWKENLNLSLNDKSDLAIDDPYRLCTRDDMDRVFRRYTSEEFYHKKFCS